jgi:hypothetical protein
MSSAAESDDLYFQLGSLVAELPDLANGPTTPDIEAWLKRAAALVQPTAPLADSIQLRLAIENLDGLLRARHARTIVTIVQRALARAELEAAPEARGAFVTANNAFDVFAAVRRVLNAAQADLLMVDARADAAALTDYAVLAPESVAVRLLAARAQEASLAMAAKGWQQRFGDERPLAIRFADAEALAEEIVVLDGATVWSVGASFSELAQDKRTTLKRLPGDAARAKIAAYSALWDAATPLAAR